MICLWLVGYSTFTFYGVIMEIKSEQIWRITVTLSYDQMGEIAAFDVKSKIFENPIKALGYNLDDFEFNRSNGCTITIIVKNEKLYQNLITVILPHIQHCVL